jgi:hypothetical protein
VQWMETVVSADRNAYGEYGGSGNTPTEESTKNFAESLYYYNRTIDGSALDTITRTDGRADGETLSNSDITASSTSFSVSALQSAESAGYVITSTANGITTPTPRPTPREARQAYERALLSYIYYHNIHDSHYNTDGCAEEHTCPHDFYKHLIWIGYSTGKNVFAKNAAPWLVTQEYGVTKYTGTPKPLTNEVIPN